MVEDFENNPVFKENKEQYLIGMSVPPVMMAQVAWQVYLQIISKYKGCK